jgi:hypothetical protein
MHARLCSPTVKCTKQQGGLAMGEGKSSRASKFRVGAIHEAARSRLCFPTMEARQDIAPTLNFEAIGNC